MGSSGPLDVVLRRAAPVFGAVGGLCFFGYWFVRAREVSVSPVAAALLDVATFLFLGTAVLAHLVAQGLGPGAWVGWAGVTALLQGLLFSPPAVCCGLFLLGVSIARSGAHSRIPGVIMATSGFALLWTFYYSSGFGRGHAEMGLVGKAVMGAALVGVAASLADLLVLEHGPEGRVGEPHHVGRA
ncbi:hypothetical protein [Pedococcus sp. P5_B7]